MRFIKAVAFDTDGVLVKSDKLHFRAFNEVLRSHGYSGLDWQAYLKGGFISYDDKRFFQEYLKGRSSLTLRRVTEFVKEKEAATIKRLKATPPPFFDYVDGVTKYCKSKGLLLFEVTGSTKEETDLYFRDHKDIKDRFQVVITASDDLPSKPDPAPYREGLKRLNQKMKTSIPANAVIAIEDSAKGVASAKKAGMFVIGIENTIKNPRVLYESGADIVVESLTTQLFSKFLNVRTREELEKAALLAQLEDVPCLSRQINIGNASSPVILRRKYYTFRNSTRASFPTKDVSRFLAVLP